MQIRIRDFKFVLCSPKTLGVSKNRDTPNAWFIMENLENPIKMDDLGVPLLLETPIWGRFFHFDGSHIFFQMGQDFTQRDGDFEGFPENNSA